MSINSVDGRFGLDMWPSRDSKIEQLSECSEDLEELTDRARVLLKGGRFKYLELCEWMATGSEWIVREVLEQGRE